MNEQLVERFETILNDLKRLASFQGQSWLSIQDTAKIVGVSEDHIRRFIRAGYLSVANIGTPDRPLYRISRKDIDTFMEQRKTSPLPPRRQKAKRADGPQPLPPSPHYPSRTLSPAQAVARAAG